MYISKSDLRVANYVHAKSNWIKIGVPFIGWAALSALSGGEVDGAFHVVDESRDLNMEVDYIKLIQREY